MNFVVAEEDLDERVGSLIVDQLTKLERQSQRFFLSRAQAIPARLWHYTSAKVPALIFASAEIWAINARQLNDQSEIRHFLDVARRELRQELADAEELPPNCVVSSADTAALLSMRAAFDPALPFVESTPYIASFSALDDDLQQWRNYADRATGAALCFDTAALVQLLSSRRAWANYVPQIFPVVYEDEDKHQLARAIVDTIVGELRSAFVALRLNEDPVLCGMFIGTTAVTLRTALWFYGAAAKHRGFRSEVEWRLVIPGPRDDEPNPHRRWHGIEYRDSSTAKGVRSIAAVGLSRSVIGAVVPAPCASAWRLRRSIEDVLGLGTAEGLVAERSSIPFRRRAARAKHGP